MISISVTENSASELTLLDPACDDGSPAGDGEGVLHRHHEGLVDLSQRRGDGLLHLSANSVNSIIDIIILNAISN